MRLAEAGRKAVFAGGGECPGRARGRSSWAAMGPPASGTESSCESWAWWGRADAQEEEARTVTAGAQRLRGWGSADGHGNQHVPKKYVVSLGDASRSWVAVRGSSAVAPLSTVLLSHRCDLWSVVVQEY